VDGGEESKTFTVLAPQCMLGGQRQRQKTPSVGIHTRYKDEPGRSVPFRLRDKMEILPVPAAAQFQKGFVIVRRKKTSLSPLSPLVGCSNRTEDGNRIPKKGITIGTKNQKSKIRWWEIRDQYFPPSARHRWYGSSFSTLYSPASRKLVRCPTVVLKTYDNCIMVARGCTNGNPESKPRGVIQNAS
jgi:hypothetical protein